jgi:hypothetical protein
MVSLGWQDHEAFEEEENDLNKYKFEIRQLKAN